MGIPMRRSQQQLPRAVCIDVLKRATSGILALNDPDQGFPYQVPLSYGYRDNKICFHGAKVGHKIDLLCTDGRASFTVIDQDEVVPKDYTTRYRSVTCTGHLRLVNDNLEARNELSFMAERYYPRHDIEAQLEIDHYFDSTAVLILDIESIIGKENSELAKMRREGLIS